MNTKVCLIFLIVTALTRSCVGLQCYACTSISKINDGNCDVGTRNVRYGTCPSGYNYCVVRRYQNSDGTKIVLRDCATGSMYEMNEEITGETRINTAEYLCSFNLCNDASVELGYSSASYNNNQHTWLWTIGVCTLCYLIGAIP